MKISGPYEMRGAPRVRILNLGDASAVQDAANQNVTDAENILRAGASFAQDAYGQAFDFLKSEFNNAASGNIKGIFTGAGDYVGQQATGAQDFVTQQGANTATAAQDSITTDANVAQFAADAILPYLIYIGVGIGGLFLLSRAMENDR